MASSAAAGTPKYVTLVSAEGHCFIVDYKCAMTSKTIKAILTAPDGLFVEQRTGRIEFPEISTKILEKVIEYFYYKTQNSSTSSLPEFKIDQSMALELLVAANFLDSVYIARISHVLQNGSNFFTSIEDKMHVPVLDKIIVADMNGKHIEKV